MPITRIPSLLHEPVGENLIATEDARKFIGWVQHGDVSVTVTQGHTIPPTATSPGSPPGEATRIETSGGASVIKYRNTVVSSPSAGVKTSGRVLLHNQGDAPIRFTLNEGSGGPLAGSTPTEIAPGETALFTSVHTSGGLGDVRFELRSDTSEDSIDCLAWGPMVEEGVVASTFPGISGTTRPTDQLTRVRDWGLADIQDGATWWFDLINEGVFADTGAVRRLYMNNDGSSLNDDGPRLFVDTLSRVFWQMRSGADATISAALLADTVTAWPLSSRVRLACRLIKDGAQHRLRIDHQVDANTPVIGTASALGDLPTTLSGTLESFFSRGDGVEGGHVAALAGGTVQHEGGTVPDFEELEEEFA